jgi:ribosome biogenesis GTPase
MSSGGTVFSAGGGVYSVELDGGERGDASMRGRLKQGEAAAGRVVIGDRVLLAKTDGDWTIESVEDRVTQLVRRGRGGRKPKVLVANLDRVLVIVSLRDPDATPELIDRLLVLVESSGMHPMLGLNKVDLDEGGALGGVLVSLYEAVGYRVLELSARTGAGIDSLREELCTGSSALIGPSGAGKSSLLNALDPGLQLRTRDVSRRTGTGRHTTVSSLLIPLECGGLVADTPGFGDVGLWGVAPEEVGACFPEFLEYREGCRFRACTHVHEPDCAVRAGVMNGEIFESRYQSYATLRAEAEEAAAER